tara:strand:- start:9822 stop:10841 length:1020 start_codon:yes stop_codon:yes gene_type:complete
MKKINVLSLFDGMSCGQIALDQLGIPVNKYYAAEIDKYAIQIARKNYPDMVHVGDVKWVTSKLLPKIDLLIGGSPCQGFSFGGKGLNFDDPRSKLFFEFDRLLKELKPKYFLLENVKMKKESEQVITDYLGVEPVEINSRLVSAQNRKRLYWTNIPFDGLPEDKGIMLKDILEEETAEFYRAGEYLQNKQGKSGTVCAGTHGYAIGYVPEPKSKDGLIHIGDAKLSDKYVAINRVYAAEGKSPTLTASTGGHTQPKVEIRDKSKCVRTGGRLSYDRHEWDSIDNMHWRKLTVTECERLQTVPDGYTCGVSNTQRYKMLGNGWTVDVIKHIFEGLKEETQ